MRRSRGCHATVLVSNVKGMISLKIICVTGTIGSGKSAVSHILGKIGLTVIDADIISREIVQKGQIALEELVKHFGLGILDSEGSLDRGKLADIAFKDQKEVEVLSNITHKYIRQRIVERIEALKKSVNPEYIIIDAAIPFDNWLRSLVDEIWVVTAELNTRINRIMLRSGLTYQKTIDRINSQKSDEDYYLIADKLILNDGTIENLEEQVLKLFER